MNRALLVLVLLLLAPLAQAHTGIYETKTDVPAIAFQVYKSKIPSGSAQGIENAFWYHAVPAGIGSNIIKPVIIWVASSAIEAVVDSAKAVTCPAVKNGDVTISLALNADLSALVFGAGATGGLAVTFKCVGKKAV